MAGAFCPGCCVICARMQVQRKHAACVAHRQRAGRESPCPMHTAEKKGGVTLKKNSSGTTWGVMLILIGIVIGGKAVGWFDFNLFFSGWWTLFIIIPSAVKFFTERGERSSALKGLCLGLLLLMAAQGFIEIRMFLPLFLAAFMVLTGMKMISRGGEKKKEKPGPDRRQPEGRPGAGRRQPGNGPERKRQAYPSDYMDASQYHYKDEYDSSLYEDGESSQESFWEGQREADVLEEDGEETPQSFEWNQYADRRQYRRGYQDMQSGHARNEYGNAAGKQYQAGYQNTERSQGRRNGHCACTAILSGKEINFSREVFDGAMLSCVLGSIDLNLSEAILYRDAVIEARAFLGGIEITVPKNVRVAVKSAPLLGGVDNHVKRDTPLPPDALTIYINASCVLGGIEIKTKKAGK